MWLMIAFSISIVLSTVLLSNDMKHLKSLMVKLGYKPSVASIHPPPLFRQGRVFKPGVVKLLPRLVAAPEPALTGAFLRAWRRDGRQYCDAVRQARIDVSEWEGSELFETGTYECSFERSWSDGPEKRSVFYLVRGNSSGRSARSAQSLLIRKQRQTASSLLIRRLRWLPSSPPRDGRISAKRLQGRSRNYRMSSSRHSARS